MMSEKHEVYYRKCAETDKMPYLIYGEPEIMDNDLEERLKTTQNRVEIALALIRLQEQVSPRYNELMATILEDMFYGCHELFPYLHSQGLVCLKVKRELPESYDSCVCAVCTFIKHNGRIPEHSLVKAGVAVEPLIGPDNE